MNDNLPELPNSLNCLNLKSLFTRLRTVTAEFRFAWKTKLSG